MEEHVDALYRVVHTATPAASTQALMLLFHVAVGSNAAKVNTNETTTELARQDRFYRALYNSLSKPSLVSHGKHLTMFFNLLYKAMKYDSDVNRVNACAKRLMSTSLHANAATIAGSLFLLNEISKTHPTLRTCLADLPDLSNANLILDDTKRDPRSALISAPTIGETMEAESTNREVILCSPFWELALISHHSHPSVSKFASTVGNIVYSGDPLKNFGLAPFLDKFAYRNPKSREKLAGHLKRGKSVAERRSGAESQIQSRLELPVNDPAFLERENVSEQDEFFFKFFVERARRDEVKGITRGTTEEMNDEELEEAEELTLDAAEKAQGLDSVKKVSFHEHTTVYGLLSPFCGLIVNFHVINPQFEEYEQAWETDPEEEAFADSLAEKLMESAADGTTDFDDEDPDMSDWSDFDDKKNKDTNDNNEAFNDDSGSFDEDGMAAVERAEAGISDEDDFMDYVSDSESDGSLGDIPTFADAEEHQKLAETDWTESKKTKKRRKT
jgi:ribosome biogenesis protein MAK21